MSKRLAWSLRLIAAVACGVLIALTLRKYVGWSSPPPKFDLARVPWVGPRVGHKEVELLWPRALWALVFVPYFALVSSASLADLPTLQRWMGVVTRSVMVVALAVAFARPTSTTFTQKVATLVVVDVSESVSDEALEDFRVATETLLRQRADNPVRLITFAQRPRVLELPERLGATERLPPFARHLAPPRGAQPGARDAGVAELQPADRPGAATDIAAALSLAYGLFPAGYLRRVLLLSDGVQTDGDALAEVARAQRFNVRVHSVPSRRGAPPEIAVRELRLPDRIRVNEPFELRAMVFASRPSRVTFALQQGEAPNGEEPSKTVELPRGESEVRFRSIVRVPGDVSYALTAQPGPGVGDRFRENNRYVTTAVVPGRPSVLYVEGDPGRAQYLRDALSSGDFEVEVRPGTAVPSSVRELERFDFVVLSDTDAASVSAGSQQAISQYVRSLGGGFLMAGGPRSFGLGGWGGTEIERLLPVRMDGERRHDQPSIALSLVIDRSGSMQGTPLEMAKQAARRTAEVLGPDDQLEVIGFDTEAITVVRMQSARNRVRIANDIARLRPGGGTAIFPALDRAYRDLQVTRAVTKHVILLSDGQAPTDGIRELVQAMVADGITVSAIGLGSGVDRTLLENIGRIWGGGRTYVTNDPSNLPQLFLRETQQVQRNSVIEEPVQPRIETQASFLRGIEGASMPLLLAYVSTRMKPAPAQLILATDDDQAEPLLARWRVGLGWSLAWTSDVKNRWAFEWIRWPRWREFWSQLVREHMRQRRRNELGLHAEIVAGRVRVAVDAITQDDRFDNGMESTLTIRGPQPNGTSQQLPLRAVAPGRYEADFPLDRYGAFALTAVHRRDGRVVAESHGRINNPYPREYAALEPDRETLAQLATATGARLDPTPAQVFDPQGERILESQPLWRFPIFAGIAVFLLDLLLRRVRLLDRGFKRGWKR
ncbi:MAG: VWA domain-containing protein [Deltaproteobacteria bacterium]|nr:VWA domain-containing protein [Deltaproteobacteria bacterium]